MIFVIAAWLATYLAHSSILLAAAWLATRLLSPRQDRWAEAIWRAALVAGVVSATASMVFPAIPGGAQMTLVGLDNGGSATGSIGSFSALGTWDSRGSFLISGVVGLWLIVAIARTIALVGAGRAVTRALARRIAIDHAKLPSRGERDSVVRVSLSSAIGTPLVLGLNEVVLPFRAVHELSDVELEAVLAHEIAHVERRDTVWLWAALLIERALWVQPLNRVAARRLRGLAECLCDDAAVRRTGSPEALATALTRVARWIQTRPAIEPALGMASTDSLALARVRRILDPARSGLPALRPSSGMAIAAIAVALLIGVGPGVRTREVSATPRSLTQAGAYTVSAYDDGGRFTITIAASGNGGSRVVGATMNEVAIPDARIQQIGNRVLISSELPGRSLDLTLTPDGGFRWTSRALP